jgi:hypothetical protein
MKKKRAEFHSILNAHISTGEPCADVVEMLKKLLAEAKRGEVIGLAVAWVHGNNDVSAKWASGCADGNLLMAAVHSLHTRVSKVWDESLADVNENS